MLTSTGCKNKVSQIKDSVWNGDKSTTLGKALDHYKGFERTDWKLIKADNGKDIVEFSGTFMVPQETLTRTKEVVANIPMIREQVKKSKYAEEYYFDQLRGNASSDKRSKVRIGVNAFDAEKNMRYFPYLSEDLGPKLDQKLTALLDDANYIQQFYSSGNRLQLVYQFVLNEDNSFKIEAAGCRTAKEQQSTNLMYDAIATLGDIYNNVYNPNICNERAN